MWFKLRIDGQAAPMDALGERIGRAFPQTGGTEGGRGRGGSDFACPAMARLGNPLLLPITTRCWLSSGHPRQLSPTPQQTIRFLTIGTLVPTAPRGSSPSASPALPMDGPACDDGGLDQVWVVVGSTSSGCFNV